jgi:hypothetical protein
MSRGCYRLGSLFLGFALPVSLLPADEVPVSWINPSGGNWNVAGNWSPGVVPNNGGGKTYAVTLNGTGAFPSLPYSVLVNTSPTIDSLLIQPAGLGARIDVEVAGTLTTGTLTTSGGEVVPVVTVDHGATLNAATAGFFSEGGLDVNGTANIGMLTLSICGGCPAVDVGSGGLLNVGTFSGGGVGTSVEGTMNIANSLTLSGITGGFDIDGGTVTVGTSNLKLLNSPNTLVNAGGILTAGTAGISVGGGLGPLGYGLQVLPNGTYDEVIGGRTSFGTLNAGIAALPVSLAGTLEITLANSYVPPVGQTFTIINTGGGAAITGTFSNIEGQIFNNGTEKWDVDYVSGTTVELVAVTTPEPSFLVLAGLGLLGIVWTRHRGPVRAL